MTTIRTATSARVASGLAGTITQQIAAASKDKGADLELPAFLDRKLNPMPPANPRTVAKAAPPVLAKAIEAAKGKVAVTKVAAGKRTAKAKVEAAPAKVEAPAKGKGKAKAAAPAKAPAKSAKGKVAAKAPAKVAKVAKAKAAAPATVRRPIDLHAKVTAIVPNPKKPGSAAHKAFALYRKGATLQAFVNACERIGLSAGDAKAHISWDRRHEFITVKG
jgi:hypothetical protein